MPESTAQHVSLGDRIRTLRMNRGLTQEELANASGVSVGVVRKIEQGGTARMETYHALARALDVVTMTFVAAGPPEPVLDGPPETMLAPIRAAVIPAVSPRGEPMYGFADAAELSLQRLTTTVAAVGAIYHSNRYDDLAQLLPPLLLSAQHHVAHLADAPTRANALRLRASAYSLAARYLIQIRAHDLALIAVQKSQQDAVTIGDTALLSAAINIQGWAMIRQGRFREVVDLCVHAADELEPRMSRATPEELSSWGVLLGRASAAAARDNRPDEADEYADLAVLAGNRIGREHHGDSDRSFGPLTAALNQAENAMVAGKPGKAVELFGRLPRGVGRTVSSTWNRALLDEARANTRIGDVGRATEIMTGLRLKAPEWLRYQQLGHDTTREIVSTAKRRLTDEQRALVDFFGLTG
ncbi:helix-turn-helix transcriptional regulator [Streptosporangium sp. NPDC051023]|uniref:helix-turn-helix domain-containing protein n=1 Tax=Streptosporangium sp. NPDC051023 TaxID=3155410 RepID=UPI00344F854C